MPPQPHSSLSPFTNLQHLELLHCTRVVDGDGCSYHSTDILSRSLPEISMLTSLRSLAVTGYCLDDPHAWQVLASLPNLSSLAIRSINVSSAMPLPGLTHLRVERLIQLGDSPGRQPGAASLIFPALEHCACDNSVGLLGFLAHHEHLASLQVVMHSMPDSPTSQNGTQHLATMPHLGRVKLDVAHVTRGAIEHFCSSLTNSPTPLQLVFYNSSAGQQQGNSGSKQPSRLPSVTASALALLSPGSVRSVEVGEGCGTFSLADLAALAACPGLLAKLHSLQLTPEARLEVHALAEALQQGYSQQPAEQQEPRHLLSDGQALQVLVSHLAHGTCIAPSFQLGSSGMWQLLVALGIHHLDVMDLQLSSSTAAPGLRSLSVYGKLCLRYHAAQGPGTSQQKPSSSGTATLSSQLGSFRLLLPHLQQLYCTWPDDDRLGCCLTGHPQLSGLCIAGSFLQLHLGIPAGLQCLAGLHRLHSLEVIIRDGAQGLPSEAVLYAVTAAPTLQHISFARLDPAAAQSKLGDASRTSLLELLSGFASRDRRLTSCVCSISTVHLARSCGPLPTAELDAARTLLGWGAS